MTTVIEWVEGDTAPTRRLQLTGHDGTPPNLNGIQEVVAFSQKSHAGAKVAHDVDVDGTPADGIVRIDRADLTAGTYLGQVQVTFSDGTIQSFPDSRGAGRSPYFTIIVHAELDPPEEP